MCMILASFFCVFLEDQKSEGQKERLAISAQQGGDTMRISKKTAVLLLGIGGATGLITGSTIASESSILQSNRVIIKYSKVSSGIVGGMVLSNLVSQQLDSPVQYVRQMSGGAYVLKLSETLSESSLATLKKSLKVDYIYPDRIMRISKTPDDARYNEQWELTEKMGGINTEEAWDVTMGDPNLKIAVVDTGYRPHEDLNDNMLSGYDFIIDTLSANDGDGRDAEALDPGDWILAGECGDGYPPADYDSSWHGTHVAGTIAAKGNNALGVTGVAFNSKIVPIRVLGKCGGYVSDIVDGLRWSVGMEIPGLPINKNTVRVINMSLGGEGECEAPFAQAIADVRARGAVVVVAAGNSSEDAAYHTPSNCPGVIAVASTNRYGNRAFYSNYGSTVDIAAPGGETRGSQQNGILSTLNTGKREPTPVDTYEFYQGTSMATPHVAGVVALMLSVKPELTPDAVEILLKNSSRAFPTGSSCAVGICGPGIMDAKAAVIAARDTGPVVPDDSYILKNGVARSGLTAGIKRWMRFVFEVPEGAKNMVVQLQGGTGDADLFVKLGSEATRYSFDAKSEEFENAEKVMLINPKAGSYSVGVYAYREFRDVSITATFE